jgi:putative membrane protein
MKKAGWIILGIVAAVALLLSGVWLGSSGTVDYPGWGMMRGGHMMGGYWGSPMMGMMGLGMLLFWGLVIGGIVWLVVRVARSQPRMGAPLPVSNAPLDILKRRYAAGEIAKEQFDEMRRNLES